MSQPSIVDTSFIGYVDSILEYKIYFPILNESNIKLWMIKPQQALNIETKYWHWKDIYKYKQYQLNESLVGYI